MESKGSSSSSTSKKPKTQDDDDDEDDDGDDDDAPKYVKDDLDDIQSSNIIPRGTRRAALASGLVRSRLSDSKRSPHSTTSRICDDSDDEEADL